MKVLVTGATGRIGSETTRQLLALGHAVRAIDVAETADDSNISGAEYRRCDILDYEGLLAQMQGCDAVVHMAAIASPGPRPAPEMFQINVSGTYNVFEAAARSGISRIVQASSINAFGCYWGIGEMDLRYFPIDEAHPTATTDPYSFSKEVIEDVGDYYWRRDNISSVALRFPAVWLEEWIARMIPRFTEGRARLGEFLLLPDSQRQERLAGAREQALAYLASRSREYPVQQGAWDFGNDDWLLRAYVHDRFNLWAYVHVADAARSIIRGLLADYTGSHALFINAERNYLNIETETLLQTFFPNITERSRPLDGAESMVSIDKARALIGFTPEYLLPDDAG